MKILWLVFISMVTVSTAFAHHHWRHIIIQPVGEIYIRGIKYTDHSRNTTLTPTQVGPGGWIHINTSSLMYSGAPNSPRYDLRVIIQDTAQPPNSSGGVTAYRLTNVRAQGTSISAQMPNYPVLRNRSYHVTVFLIGPQPMHYAYAGVVRLN